MHPKMNLLQVFEEFDLLRDHRLAPDDLINYEKQFYIKLGETEANWIIKEYDSNEDSFLDIDEFSQMILPSTN